MASGYGSGVNPGVNPWESASGHPVGGTPWAGCGFPVWTAPAAGPIPQWPAPPAMGGGQDGSGAWMGRLRDLTFLREDLVGELQAITQYEQHAALAVDPRVRELLLHIADDERHHVVELTRLLAQLDPLQARAFQERQPHGYGPG